MNEHLSWNIEREITFDLSVDKRVGLIKAVEGDLNHNSPNYGYNAVSKWKRCTRVYLFQEVKTEGRTDRTVIEVKKKRLLRSWLDSKLWTPRANGTLKLQSKRTYLTLAEVEGLIESVTYECGFVKLKHARKFDVSTPDLTVLLKLSIDTICPFDPSDPFKFSEPFGHVELEFAPRDTNCQSEELTIEDIPLSFLELFETRATISKRERSKCFSPGIIASSKNTNPLKYLIEAVAHCKKLHSLK